uniref:Nuclear receptor domain-containing protein n=1 Tax=Panagrellus redivivus TaxID=6233 RepID=A0A7E4ZVI8_PANRE
MTWFQAGGVGLGTSVVTAVDDLFLSASPFGRVRMATVGSGHDKLPPGTNCAVCNDLATGNHYNVASCSGCKTFFRRAVVNNRAFACIGDGNCFVSKDVRCACRHCRFKKCLEVGMSPSAIQNDRDRIGYTKRTRRKVKESNNGITATPSPDRGFSPFVGGSGSGSGSTHGFDCDGSPFPDGEGDSPHAKGSEPLLERLAQLENNFSLLLSRGHVEPYATLDDALSAPSRFSLPINVKITDPIATPTNSAEQCQMPFWRSRIIALYIDWAKTFSAFRKLPYADKIALITNHASSYMIMCEAFRTPEHKEDCPEMATNTNTLHLKKEPLDIDEPMPMSSTVPENGGNNGDYAFPASVHTFFDPELIREGNSCLHTGVRSLVDVPPTVHYPTVGGLSGLTPVMAIMIDYVMKPFRKLKITTTEFATLQAIMFFDPDTEGLDAASQRNVTIEQKKFLNALYNHICTCYDPMEASERYSAILLRIPTIRKVAAKKNESLQIIDMFNLFTLNTLVKETTLGIRQQQPQPSLEQN